MYTRSKLFILVPCPPLFWCTLSLLCGNYIACVTTIHVVLIVSIISIGIAYKKPKNYIRPACLSCFFFLGLIRTSFLYRSLRHSTQSLEHKILKGTGTIVSCEKTSARFHRACITLTIQTLETTFVPRHSTVQIYVQTCPQLEPGDLIAFTTLQMKQQKNVSFIWYLYKQGIIGTLFSTKFKYRLIHRPYLNLLRLRYRIRKRVLKNLSQALSKNSYALFLALFLGKRDKHYDSLRSSFTWWGTVHYLARSGLHLVVLATLWRILLHRWLPFFIAQIIVSVLIILYYALSWPSVSFNRAIIAFLLYQGYTFTGRSVQMLQVISLTTVLLLIVNPLHLFFLDFQLSFGLTAALALFSEIGHQIRIFKHLDGE